MMLLNINDKWIHAGRNSQKANSLVWVVWVEKDLFLYELNWIWVNLICIKLNQSFIIFKMGSIFRILGRLNDNADILDKVILEEIGCYLGIFFSL